MKLKEGMVLGNIDNENFAIATGKATKNFNGIIHNNETATFIFKMLQTDQTFDSLTKLVLEHYEIDEETVKNDVKEVIDILEKANILDK